MRKSPGSVPQFTSSPVVSVLMLTNQPARKQTHTGENIVLGADKKETQEKELILLIVIKLLPMVVPSMPVNDTINSIPSPLL